MREQQIRTVLEQHGSGSAAGDLGAERDIYQENAVCEYPQSGERIHRKEKLKSLRGHAQAALVDSSSAASVAPEKHSGSRNM
jgi:hypothetical protein